jgi:hypothetical protein
LILEQPHFVA